MHELTFRGTKGPRNHHVPDGQHPKHFLGYVDPHAATDKAKALVSVVVANPELSCCAQVGQVNPHAVVGSGIAGIQAASDTPRFGNRLPG